MHNWLIGYYIVEFEMTIPSLSIAEQGDSLYIVCYLRRALSDFKNLRSFSLFTNTTSWLSRTSLNSFFMLLHRYVSYCKVEEEKLCPTIIC